MEWAQLPIVQLGALGLLFGFLWMVFTGRLVPKSTVDDMRADRDARLAEKSTEASEYKAAWLTEVAAREEQGKQLHELMEYARTTDQFIHSLRGSEEGPRHAISPP